MIESQFFPRCACAPERLRAILQVFTDNEGKISSDTNKKSSNEVLKVLRRDLESLNVRVEQGKTNGKQINIPVLFGRNGAVDKSFCADAYDEVSKTVIEVEAGRAYTNHQFLKDLFEACVMHDVDYAVIAVRRSYRNSQDFENVFNFMDTLYASGRMQLPLKGVLIIGY